MKRILKALTLLAVPFMAIGCSQTKSTDAPSSGSQPGTSSNAQVSSDAAHSTVAPSSAAHVHEWEEEWSYNESAHWHACKGCSQLGQSSAHNFGAWESTKGKDGPYKDADARIRTCAQCGYYQLDGDILPRLDFNFGATNSDGQPQEVNFATIATKNDISRPEVEGTYTLSNCDSKYAFANVKGTMKVRGNQTANWRKKAFRMKFGSKRNVLGLNNGGVYKKWILLADAKDTTLIRSAAGLYIAREICKDERQIWVCDYTPVSVYLNGQYWGFYYLGEQKEVKSGEQSIRVRLDEVDENYTGVDIGYCFELDHYADSAGSTGEASEFAKGKDGDPTFRMKYSPNMAQGRPSGPLAAGQVCTYTMLSDITDGPKDVHVQADYSSVDGSGKPQSNATKTSNSQQLSFIRDRMELLYQVLYEAAMNNKAKEINAAGTAVVNSTKTVKQVIEQYFDVPAWVDGSIINAFTCPPDLGYSSFYMSYDNTENGDHKLRFDCPWDFDSNFGNRNNFYVEAQTDTYVENTYNTWLYLFNKLSFFIDAVKVKWNQIREAKSFEGMFAMIRKSFHDYDAEIKKNHTKWPQNDAASMNYNNFDEIRDPYKNPSQYKTAESETINWCAKRINFLESKWGSKRPNIDTTGK